MTTTDNVPINGELHFKVYRKVGLFGRKLVGVYNFYQNAMDRLDAEESGCVMRVDSTTKSFNVEEIVRVK